MFNLAQEVATTLGTMYGVPAIRVTEAGPHYLTRVQRATNNNGPVFTYTRQDKVGA